MAAPFATGPIPRRQFTITRPTFGQHYDVVSRDGQEHLFYIDVSCSFSRSQPDLTVHAGPNTAAPVVAVAHMPKLSGPFKIGLGDPISHPNAVRWEDMMRRASPLRRCRRNAHLFPRPAQLQARRRGDERGPAVFTSERGHSACGVLQVNTLWGPDFDLMVLTTCVATYEKARRRSSGAAAATA
ncbi:hypothetical protein ACCO45_002603 [Purpureocillium lilacinum]|uniref:Uncharacterized protein n=1 Tax=Purpureocillium lilacinum TaxID=33203 RepID=A0ACC4EAC4_PURLI